jgi:hypothetical protein
MLFPIAVYTLAFLISLNVVFARLPYWKAIGFCMSDAPRPGRVFACVYGPVALLVGVLESYLPEEYATPATIAAHSIAAAGVLYHIFKWSC